jgi:3-phosphoshikimate 1-carboxyvinyltransferase
MGDRRLIEPASGPLDVDVSVPASKSIANRVLVCAALADGPSTIEGVPDGDDSAAMVDCLVRLGVAVVAHRGGDAGDDVTVRGNGGRFPSTPITLDARLAGTTSRFVTALAALADGPVTIDGGAPLRSRPMADLHRCLAELGAELVHLGEPDHLPVVVRRGRLAGGTVALAGNVSSQFVSALMLIAPMLDGGITIELTTELVSRPYVDITAAVMRDFGAVTDVSDTTIRVEPGRYRPTHHRVEADASSASYPLAAAAIVGGRVRVRGLGRHALQGDAGFADLLATMGCDLVRDDDSTEVSRGSQALQGIDVDMRDMSDLVPTLAVVAATAVTPTRIRGVGFIRAKESDRLGDLAAELRVLGVDIVEDDDGLTVRPSILNGGVVQTHHDHRLAMSLSLLGLAIDGVVVTDPEVVAKSWPAWWQTLEVLRR